MSTGAIILAACLVAVIVAVIAHAVRSPKPLSVLRWRRVGNDYEFITRWSDGSERVYRGYCTVWSHYPSGDRCDLELEWWLLKLWKRAKWEEEDREAKS